MQIALESRGTALMKGALEYVGLPIFICDEAGSLKGETTEAAALLSAGRFRVMDGKIGLPHPRDDAALLQALARRHRQPLGVETLLLGSAGKQMPMVVDICRLPSQPRRLSLASQILVIVRSGRRWHDAAPAILRAAFGLSAAEAEVALALGRGETRDQIAAARDTSAQTIKTQIKSIFSKLEVSREMELMAMLGDLLHR
jgi:DNA-binding CsgD family transcriptional regulator